MATKQAAQTAVELELAGARLHAARAEYEAAREAIEPLIVKALKAGTPQKDVIRMSGLVRETVRAIARKGGIAGPDWARK